MKKNTILLTVLVILFLILAVAPVSAIMAIKTGDGVSRGDYDTLAIYEAKDTWKKSESSEYVTPWVSISPGSDLVCNGNSYISYRYRLLTPEGLNYNKVVFDSTYDAGNGLLLSGNPISFTKDKAANWLKVSNLISNANQKGFGWQGTWTQEFYFADFDCIKHETSTWNLVSTKKFTLVDDSVSTTTVPYTTGYVTPTTQKTTVPYTTGYVTPTTSKIPSPSNQIIIIDGEKYVDANVKKTGATWDSVEEKCPTWRGNDWSGTGDYYLSNGGDTLTYLINSPATGNYVMWMRDWSDTNHAAGDRQVTITIDGATIGTFDAASSFNKGTTGYGWDKLTTVNLGAGSHTMKIIKKDTTSSAAIIDDFWFSSNLNEIPQGYTPHSEALCSATTVTRSIAPTTSGITYQPVCTPPICPSGKYVCLQNNGCPGGCGYSCDTVSSQTTVPPTRSGIETVVILLAIGLGVVVFAKRRN
jgi:hypothetical protein